MSTKNIKKSPAKRMVFKKSPPSSTRGITWNEVVILSDKLNKL